MIARLSAAAATILLLTACSGGAADEPAPSGPKKPAGSSGATGSSGGGDTGSSGSSGSSGTTDTPDTTTPLPKPDGTDPKACKLPELTATDVSPSFLTYDPPTTQPTASKGGKIDGKYTIDKATVYLPTSTKGLVKIPQSSGKVNGWAIFNGKNYRINLNVDLKVQPIIGQIMEQKNVVVDQGTFSATGAGIKLETSCTGAAAPAAKVTFTESGARGILLIEQEIPQRGTSYLVLEAARVAE